MLRTVEEYVEQFRALQPRGMAWPRELGARLFDVYAAWAEELAAVHNAALEILDEADPRTTSLMLTDWERVFGLPDCGPLKPTKAERRDVLVEKMTRPGGQSPQDIVDAAARVGFEVEVSEYSPFTCSSECDDPLNQGGWRFAFRVDAPEETVRIMNCESGCDEPLRSWGNETLECVVAAIKPAHTVAVHAYGA